MVSGLNENTSLRTLRDAFSSFGVRKQDVAYVHYEKGQTSTKYRLKSENSAYNLLKTIRAREEETGKPFQIDSTKVTVFSVILVCKEELNLMLKVIIGLVVMVWWV